MKVCKFIHICALVYCLGCATADAVDELPAPPVKQGSCPAETVTGDQLTQRINQSRATLSGLKKFISGESLGEIPAVSLFIVDLAGETEIERRVGELQQDQMSSPTRPPKAGTLLDCAGQHQELAEDVNSLSELQVEINRLRLEFLTLPKLRRDALLNVQRSLVLHAESATSLAREQLEAEQQQSAASQSAEHAEIQARSAESAIQREIAAQRALLEKTREELANIKIKFSIDLGARATTHKNTASRLSNLAGLSLQGRSPEQAAQTYADVVVIWRDLVDQILARIADPERYEPIPRLPDFPQVLLTSLSNDENAQAYRASYQSALTEHHQLSSQRQERYATERDNVFRLLLAASKLRSELLKENVALGNTQITALSSSYLADLYREVRIVPYRLYAFITTTWIDFREKGNSGFEGLYEIVQQLLIFAIFVSIPFLAYRAVRWAAGKLENLRRQIIREQFTLPQPRQRSARLTAIAIQRVNTYLPWVIMLLGLWLANRLVANTVFSEVAAVLPYLGYYIWYRIFVTFVSSTLGIIAYTGTMQGLTARSKRVQTMAQRVGAFFFIALGILHATQDVVGEALVYQLVVAAMIYLGLIIWAVAAHHWREEIISSSRRALPAWAAQRIERNCSGWTAWLACLPAMILVVAGLSFGLLNKWASQTNVLKRIGAELFRRRVENATPDQETREKLNEQQLPGEYLDWFDLGAPTDASLLVDPTSGIIAKVLQRVETWKNSIGGEHSLALIGDKGSGKSSLLRVIEHSSNDCRIIRITIPPKLVTREAVLALFAQQLRHDLSEGAEALVAADASHQQTLILVDEAHNLFLGAIGGFEGYRTFMELVNARTSNLFWCVAFNQRSWDYLIGVFGSNQYFRNSVELPPMTDADIQNLILTRHRRTGYTLSYDQIIRATQSPEDFGGLAHIETQFFRLLWGQSKGNPRAAIVLWISALHTAGNKRLKVGIPYFKPIRGMAQIGDDAMFVYAAIIRHENLSAEEAVTTTDLAAGVVQDAIRIGIDTQAIIRGADERYRASPTSQFALIQLLIGKNFIHE